jgi:hypothetical protein
MVCDSLPLMPWNRNDPDPLEARRRQLAEQERLLAEQRKLLTEQLRQSADPSAAQVKPAEPPVWRMEDDSLHKPVVEPTSAPKRNLARQRQRDMLLFFVFIIVFLIVMSILLWVAYYHNTAPATGA